MNGALNSKIIAVNYKEENNMWRRIKGLLYMKALISSAVFVKKEHADTAQLISETASNDAQLF